MDDNGTVQARLKPVLIETLWNVKFLRSDTMSITNVGINRNIVECKDFGQSVTMHVTEVLIETLWNVKDTIKNLYIISVMLY